MDPLEVDEFPDPDLQDPVYVAADTAWVEAAMPSNTMSRDDFWQTVRDSPEVIEAAGLDP